jgi:hypothetical protein
MGLLHAEYPGVSAFLYGTGAAFLLAFALPLFLSPLAWARRFLWTIPEDTRLTVYFGRCLGAVAVALVAACFHAAADPVRHSVVLLTLAVAGFLLTLVHVWGAIQRTQPWTETAEIALYGGLTVALVWMYLRVAGA